jgi:hypothetical protein
VNGIADVWNSVYLVLRRYTRNRRLWQESFIVMLNCEENSAFPLLSLVPSSELLVATKTH